MRWLYQFGRDVKHAVRAIGRMPGLAAVVIVSLGIGIGINTVVFTWIQARLLRPWPGVSDGARFQLIEPHDDASVYPGASWPEYRDLRDTLRSFREVIAFRMVPLYVGEAGQVERLYGQFVSGNYFSALALKPAVGRFLQADDVARAGGEPVAVISNGLWQRRFGGTSDVTGRTMRVNGRELSIVGVTPAEFQGTVPGLDFDMWVPATLAPALADGSGELEDRRVRGYAIVGRLQPGTTRAQAQAELDAAMRQLAQAYPETNRTIGAEVLPQSQSPRGPQRMLNTALAILQGMMLLLLLAVCGNTANLVLARASTRQREVGMRLALGAAPWRIATMLIAENVVLALAGSLLGAALAVWGTKALLVLPLTGLPLKFQMSVDGLTLSFAIALGLLSGLVTGAIPALQLSLMDPLRALRAGMRSSGRSLVRSTLMGVQVALATVVLIAAGLFLRSFLEARSTDTGFRREGVLLAGYDLRARNMDDAETLAFLDRLLERARALRGVEAAAVSLAVPLDIHGLPARAFTIEGRARTDRGVDQALANVVSPGYFATMEIPFRAGRDFAPLLDATTAPQAIVNDAFARRYVEPAEPIGRLVSVRGRTYTIVGVVRNSLSNAFGEPPTPVVYLSYRENPWTQGEIHLRTRPGAEMALATEIRRIIRELDPELPVFNVRTLSDHVETNLVLRRIPARIFAVLGPLLLVLAAIGIYAVVAYSVSLRTTEIGVRLALGATVRRVIALFVGQSLIVIGAGAAIGWLAAFMVALHLQRGTINLPVFLGVPAILMIVAVTACWLPARRATRLDPVVALRQE